MSSNSHKSITFSVDSPEVKEVLSKIAKEKGFDRVGAMARVATYQYVNRFGGQELVDRLRDVQGVRPQANRNGEKE